MTGQITIRPTAPDDAPEILALIRELASFEREPHAVAITEAVIRRDAFGPRARFQVLFAERDGQVVGFVSLLPGYSSWAGKPTLTVHDLFLREAARGLGAGRALLAAAAREAVARGAARMDVNVLHWNTPARAFYQGLGFVQLEDWLPYRITGSALLKLAEP